MESILVFLCIALLAPTFAHGTATFGDCGSADKIIKFKAGSISPTPLSYPGNIVLTSNVEVTEDIPAFEMKVNIFKLDPNRMVVPCLNNLGSCSYDVCEMIENYRDEICPMFPDPSDCGCPIKAGTYKLKDAVIRIPDYGDIFATILQGHYVGNMTFNDPATKKEFGCSSMTFEITPSNNIIV